MAFLDDHLKLCEALRSKDASIEEAALQEKYDSLMANYLWEFPNFTKDCKSVGCKRLFRTKRDALGEIIRHKVQLVAKEYFQVDGVDINETFVLMAKFITIRCIFTIIAAINWEI